MSCSKSKADLVRENANLLALVREMRGALRIYTAVHGHTPAAAASIARADALLEKKG